MKSPAETLLAVQLEQAGIPFEREYKFCPSGLFPTKTGRDRKWRADFALWDHPLSKKYEIEADYLVEIEGGIGGASRHLSYTGFTNDAIKYNAAAELGYRVLRYTPRMIESGEALEQIRRILSMKEQAA
jgi:hypothetical protein